ncbi:acyl-CoA synthetase FdrA [Candidatus Hodarchaeum mangrovi]
MSVIKTHLIKQHYRDSVQLMRAASQASRKEGIELASVLMGTPKNKPLLEEVNLLTEEAKKASPNDIIISVKAKSETHAEDAINFIIQFLTEEVESSLNTTFEYRSLRSVLVSNPDINLTIISVPGEYAVRETRLALEKNINVLLFSDNVSIEDEIRLKKEAHKRNLILMGPDCGTAMINNVGLAFANVVQPGPIGIVAASGTGTQEVMVLCHHLGVGIKHALGTGSNDVKDKVMGISMIDGLLALEKDPTIELIIIVSKPPEDLTFNRVLDFVKKCKKNIIINFLGKQPGFCESSHTITVRTLEESALSAQYYFKQKSLKRVIGKFSNLSEISLLINKSIKSLSAKQKYIRGLYVGGTFTFEAAMIILDYLPEGEKLWTNISLKNTELLDDPMKSREHTLIDLGADEFTVGKPHPMIDQTERTRRFLQEVTDPQVAVILIDFVLGFGSHINPVEDMMEALTAWKNQNHKIFVVAHVCGTELDPQDYEGIIKTLKNLGVYIMPSNAQAALLASYIAFRKQIN